MKTTERENINMLQLTEVIDKEDEWKISLPVSPAGNLAKDDN